jgi:hypothetical protein
MFHLILVRYTCPAPGNMECTLLFCKGRAISRLPGRLRTSAERICPVESGYLFFVSQTFGIVLLCRAVKSIFISQPIATF